MERQLELSVMAGGVQPPGLVELVVVVVAVNVTVVVARRFVNCQVEKNGRVPTGCWCDCASHDYSCSRSARGDSHHGTGKRLSSCACCLENAVVSTGNKR